jgi:hypothetical protein
VAELVDSFQSPAGRPAYESPRAMRLRDAARGAGACSPQGSGDMDCMDGNGARGCVEMGSSAKGCSDPGNSAASGCSAGSGFD